MNNSTCRCGRILKDFSSTLCLDCALRTKTITEALDSFLYRDVLKKCLDLALPKPKRQLVSNEFFSLYFHTNLPIFGTGEMIDGKPHGFWLFEAYKNNTEKQRELLETGKSVGNTIRLGTFEFDNGRVLPGGDWASEWTGKVKSDDTVKKRLKWLDIAKMDTKSKLEERAEARARARREEDEDEEEDMTEDEVVQCSRDDRYVWYN